MKRILMIAAVGAMLSMGSLQAQEKDSVVTLPTVTVTSTTKVTNAVDNAFRKAFPNAQKLRWYKLNKDYLAKFIAEDVNHNTLYAKNGYMKYDISFGHENNLPAEIRDRVKAAYEDYKITRAVNVKYSDSNIWVINLEGMNYYLLLRLEGEELEEVQKISKA